MQQPIGPFVDSGSKILDLCWILQHSCSEGTFHIEEIISSTRVLGTPHQCHRLYYTTDAYLGAKQSIYLDACIPEGN